MFFSIRRRIRGVWETVSAKSEGKTAGTDFLTGWNDEENNYKPKDFVCALYLCDMYSCDWNCAEFSSGHCIYENK